MPQLNCVDQLLQSLCGEAALHSASRFSVDLAARARKLETYQAAEPSLFCLKWAQAGLAGGAARVNFRLSYERSEMEFALSECPETSDWFCDEPQTQWLQLVRTAVEAALCDNPRGLSLDYGDRQLLGWGAVAERSPTPTGILRLTTFQSKRPWYKRFSPNPRLAQVHRDISTRLALAPGAIVLDGRLINCPNPDFEGRRARPAWMTESLEPTESEPHFLLSSPWLLPARLTLIGDEEIWRQTGQFTTISRRLHVAKNLLRTEKADRPHIPHFWQQATGRLPGAEMACDFRHDVPLYLVTERGIEMPTEVWFYHHARVLGRMTHYLEPNLASPLPHCPGLALPSLRMHRWLGLPCQPGGPSRLYYLQHGLLLEPIEIQTRVPGTVAIVARADVQTDLSQTRPVQDDQARQDIEWVKKTTESLVQDISPILRDPQRCNGLGIDPKSRNAWTSYLSRR